MALALDASALVYAIRSPAPSAARLRRRLGQETSHAPQLIDAELGNVLRRTSSPARCRRLRPRRCSAPAPRSSTAL